MEYFPNSDENTDGSRCLSGYAEAAEAYREWRRLLVASRAVVIRLHGPDREGMERDTGKQWDRRVVRRDEEVATIVEMAQDLVAAGVQVYLNVSNHHEGLVPLTIEPIKGLLGRG